MSKLLDINDTSASLDLNQVLILTKYITGKDKDASVQEIDLGINYSLNESTSLLLDLGNKVHPKLNRGLKSNLILACELFSSPEKYYQIWGAKK